MFQFCDITGVSYLINLLTYFRLLSIILLTDDPGNSGASVSRPRNRKGKRTEMVGLLLTHKVRTSFASSCSEYEMKLLREVQNSNILFRSHWIY